MTRLEHLQECMRSQFIWDRSGAKLMQTNEAFEGSKDLARMIFVGLADMYGFQPADVQIYLDMEYDSYRNKLATFKRNWKEVLRRIDTKEMYVIDDPVKKFYHKVGLCLNSIRWKYRHNPFLKLEDWIDNEQD